MEEVSQEFKDEVLVLGLDIGPFVQLGDTEDALRLLADLNISYPNGTTSEIEMMRAYQVLGTPTFYFISPDGTIVKKWAGGMGKEKMVASTAELITASANSG